MENFTVGSLQPNPFTKSLTAEKTILDTKISIISDGGANNQLWIQQDGFAKRVYGDIFIDSVVDEANEWIAKVQIFCN